MSTESTVKSANPPIANAPRNAIPCLKCRTEGRNGIIIKRQYNGSEFLACSLGKDVCKFTSDIPKTENQKKALLKTTCHQCNGVMRFKLPKEKGKFSSLICLSYPTCSGARNFNEKDELVSLSLEYGDPCQQCGEKTVKKGPFKGGNYAWACTGYKPDGTGCNAPLLFIDRPVEFFTRS